MTPEILITTNGDQLQTEALAGSAPRGKTAGEDARFASELLSSDKDLHEHALVADSIVRRLIELGVDAEMDARPGLRVLPNVQHLLTGIRGKINTKSSFWKLLETLHPTPAVGGTPVAGVLSAINELEDHPRGLYAGTLGWVGPTGDGHAVVAIRSASRVRFAGTHLCRSRYRKWLSSGIRKAGDRFKIASPARSSWLECSDNGYGTY